jgi:hypothetical protein
MTQQPIKVFGEKAADIEEGDTFRAKILYVEGRKVVELVKI